MRTAQGMRKRRRRHEGGARYLTFSCFRNQPFLRAERCCLWLIESIDAARHKQPFDLWAWTFMPTHIHILLLPHRGIRVPSILRAVKEPMAKRACAWVRRTAPEFLPRMLDVQPSGRRTARFWQRGGGHDRNIVSTDEVREKIDYIHHNAVRAGLVDRPSEWPWSSFRAWHEGVDEPLALDRASFPSLDR